MGSLTKVEGFIGILKPPGMTSHDVVQKARRLLNTKRVGHLGTLDPDVAGVLPIAVGQATRLIEYLSDTTKVYRGEIVLGRATDSQDASGKTIFMGIVPTGVQEKLVEAMRQMSGEQLQIPPMVSAVSVKGKRLYQYAREGIDVQRDGRAVRIEEWKLLRTGKQENSFVFDVRCSAGTYVRTLCHDVGQLLGCGAHLGWLIRTGSGNFYHDNCHNLEELSLKDSLNWLGMAKAVAHLPSIELPEHRLTPIRQGLAQRLENLLHEGQVVAMMHRQQLVAMGVSTVDSTGMPICKPRKVFSH